MFDSHIGFVLIILENVLKIFFFFENKWNWAVNYFIRDFIREGGKTRKTRRKIQK